MPKRLKKLQITRIDLVPAGANPDAHIRLFKAADVPEPPVPPVTKEDDGDDHMPLTTEQILQRNQLWAQWHPLWDAFTSSVWEVMSCCEDAEHHAAVLMQSIDQFATKAREILSGLGLVEKAAPLFSLFADVEKAGRVMSAQRMRRLKDAITTLQTMLDEAMASSQTKHTNATPATKGVSSMADKDMVEAAVHAAVVKERDEAVQRAEAAETLLKTHVAALDAVNAELAKARMTPEEEEEAYVKGLPESVRKRLEAERTEKAALKEALALITSRAERNEYISKAATYAAVGMVPDDDWETLQAIDKMDEKPRGRVLQLLKAAGEQLKASKLLRTVGTDAREPSGTTEDQVLAQAEELVATNKAATIGDAISLVFKAHPDLHAAWNAQRRTGTRLQD